MYTLHELKSLQDIQFTPSLRRGMDFFENILLHVYEEWLRHGDVAIDCGANRGLHTFPMAEAVGNTGRVFAFEAQPGVGRELKESTAHLPQVTVVNKAVSNETGRAMFNIVVEADGLSGLALNPDFKGTERIDRVEVDTTSLDDAIPAELEPRFIKMDVEGHEFYALQGAKRIMLGNRPVIVFENSSGHSEYFGYKPMDMIKLMDDMGYDLLDIFGRRMNEPETWRSPVEPWYKIAVPYDFRQRSLFSELPEVVRRIASEMRRPTLT